MISLRSIFAKEKLSVTAIAVVACSVLIQASPSARELFIYDRNGIVAGQIWRLWTGHIVHFGWVHLVADAGLFLNLGRLIERIYPTFWLISCALLPPIVAGGLLFFEPDMMRYSGLSGVNVGLLVFLALQGWQKNWVDWFWPAVLLLHVAEVLFEASNGSGTGGGFIRFDDARVHVATCAHIVGAAFGASCWFFQWARRHRRHFVEA